MIKKDSDLLIHYGVKGMRWGVRKSRSSSGSSSIKKKIKKLGRKATKPLRDKKRKKQNAERNKKMNEKAKKRPQDMTNSELQDYHTQLTSKKKLMKAANNSSLDAVTRAEAKMLARRSSELTTSELKKKADTIDNRSRLLTDLDPGKKKNKMNFAQKAVVDMFKETVISEKNMNTLLDKTVGKNKQMNPALKKAIVKVGTQAGKQGTSAGVDWAFTKRARSKARKRGDW